MSVTTHDFTRPNRVSLWTTTRPIEGLHHDFLEGCDQLFMWLLVDYDVAIDGAFATNFTRDGHTRPLGELLRDLHASESFSEAVVKRAGARGLSDASFVLALYDYDYDLEAVGLPADETGSPWLSFVGAFDYRQ
jgi:hypothetical protein